MGDPLALLFQSFHHGLGLRALAIHRSTLVLEPFLPLVHGLRPRFEFGFRGAELVFTSLKVLSQPGDLLRFFLLRLEESLLFCHPIVQFAPLRFRGLLRMFEEAHRLRLDVGGVLFSLPERGGEGFEFLRPFRGLDRGPFPFLLSLGELPGLRSETLFGPLDFLLPPIRFRLPLLKDLSDLVRLDLAFLQGRVDRIEAILPLCQGGRPLFHAGRGLGQVREFLLQIPLRAGQFRLATVDGLLPGGRRLFAVRDPLGALFEFFRVGPDLLFQGDLDRLVAVEVLLGSGDLAGLGGLLPRRRLLRLPLGFELRPRRLHSFLAPGENLGSVGKPGLEFAKGRLPLRQGLRSRFEGSFSTIGLDAGAAHLLGL